MRNDLRDGLRAHLAAGLLLGLLFVLAACGRQEQLRNACGQDQAWAQPKSAIRDNSPLTRVVDQALSITPGMTVWDIGAGAGYWTRRIAKKVGPTGRVLATEVTPACVEFIRQASNDWEVTNVQALHATGREPCGEGSLAYQLLRSLDLPPLGTLQVADRILLSNSIMFDSKAADLDPKEVSEVLFHALKKGGQMIYLRDFDTPGCMTANALISQFSEVGFILVDEADPAALHDPSLLEAGPDSRCRIFAQFSK